jgi:meso-butanediol dehydrogenase/(S,S)-butanediol dehydrogenase/diacetyl reductase
MGNRLQGKIAIATASGSGIGRACALRFAAEGAVVVVNDIRPDAAREVVTEIEAAGGQATAVIADVSRSAEVDAVVKEAVARHGRLDVLLNNASALCFGTVEQMTDDLWRQVFAVTLDGTFYGMRAAIPVMRAQGGGSIINTSSAAGLGGVPGIAAYGAAKAAVVSLTKTAAVENAARNVRVNSICPGSIDTPALRAFVDALPGGRLAFERQIPARRIGRADEIASVALFLASDEASYVTGAVIVADGGAVAGVGAPWSEPEEPTPAECRG